MSIHIIIGIFVAFLKVYASAGTQFWLDELGLSRVLWGIEFGTGRVWKIRDFSLKLGGVKISRLGSHTHIKTIEKATITTPSPRSLHSGSYVTAHVTRHNYFAFLQCH